MRHGRNLRLQAGEEVNLSQHTIVNQRKAT